MSAGNEKNKEGGDDFILLKGRIERRHYGAYSKSEHEALYINTSDGSYIIRQRGANPFHNAELEALEGQEIEASGQLRGNIFFVRSWVKTGD